MNQNQTPTRPTWDPLIRIGHWSLVIAFFTAYLAGDDFFTVHKWAGYVVATYVLIRIILGFIGSRHARFIHFVRGPGAVFSYLRALVSGNMKDYPGHNPAGGAMVVALLFSLLVTTASGAALYAVEDNAGPLAGIVTAQVLAPLAPAFGEDEDENKKSGEAVGEDVLEGAHKTFVYITLILVGLHLAGVVASSLAHRENLARAMITGRKRKHD